MQRYRIIYSTLFSLVLSDAALAADQEKKMPDGPRHSGTTAAEQTTAASSGSPAARRATTVERIKVRGHIPATVASSATKTNTPLVETAQSVTVITRDEMDARGVLTLN